MAAFAHAKLAIALLLFAQPLLALRVRRDYDELDAAFVALESRRNSSNASSASASGNASNASALPVLEPVMSRNERGRFYWYLSGATNYLEFGSGGTTIAAIAHQNVKRIHTVESDPAWIAMLMERRDVREAMQQGRLNLVYADLGRAGGAGPAGPMNYSDYYATLHDDKAFFDLVLVDGHYRDTCMLRCLQRVPKNRTENVQLLVHDYWNIPRAVKGFVERVDRVDSLAVLHKRKDVDEEELAAAAANYTWSLTSA